MKLQTKLIGGFVAIALVTLAVSGFGYWQARQLGRALYEVGIVRLPSLQGLHRMQEAVTALDAALRVGLWSAEPARLAEEAARQEAAWRQADAGRARYEPLPQTPEEAVQWGEFVPRWQAWKTGYDALMTRLADAERAGDSAGRAEARRRYEEEFRARTADVHARLAELIALNERVANAAQQQSVDSYRTMQRGQNLGLAAAVVAVLAAVGIGVLASRRLSRPFTQMAEALSRAARGDLGVRVPVHSTDELGQMADGLNRMVESVRANEARLKVISDNVPNGVVYQLVREADGTMRFLYVSAGVERLHGLTPGCVLEDYSAIFRQYVDEDRPRLVAARNASLADMSVFNVVVRCRRRDGELRWMNVSAAPRYLPDGRPVWDGIEIDITEIERSARRLQESEMRFRAVVENSGDAIATSKDGRIVFANPAFVALFGYASAADVLERPVFDFIAPVSRPEVEARLARRSLGEPVPPAYELTALRRDGTTFEMEVRSASFLIGDERYVVAIQRDITDRKLAEAQRVESVRLREQLLQAQKMETLGALAAGIAHDFNNLLTGINGFVDLATGTLPPGHEAAGLLRHAKQGAMNARDLVRRILTFSRRSRETRRVALQLGDVVRETAPLLSAVLPANVAVVLDVAPDLPSVLADAGQVQQILMNLCTNGAHAIGSRPGTLRIGVEAFDCTVEGTPPRQCPRGPYVRLSVADSGSGMDPTTLARIFDPFFTTKGVGEGTGLGLFIVQDIAAGHKAGVDVTSVAGRGTTFVVSFPAHGGTAAPRAVQPAETVGRSGSGQRILVVDDEPSVLAVLRLALPHGGYAPTPFDSSAEAWVRFAENPSAYDLLIIDQQMPEINGVEFVARVRRIAPAVPIIVMSGHFERSEEALASLFGPKVATLKKPFEIAEVLRLVRSLLAPRENP